MLHKGLSPKVPKFFTFSSSHIFKDLDIMGEQIMGMLKNTNLWLFYLRRSMKESVLTVFWNIAQKSEKIMSPILDGLMQH